MKKLSYKNEHALRNIEVKEQAAFPPSRNTKMVRVAPKYRCPACQLYYPIDPAYWTHTDDGEYCNGCATAGYYKLLPPPIVVDSQELLNF